MVVDISKLPKENLPRKLRVLSRGGSHWLKDGQRMTVDEVQFERWKPTLATHLKEAFDRNLSWPDALQIARVGCVQENTRLHFITGAIPDISRILDLLEKDARSDWLRWMKTRDA